MTSKIIYFCLMSLLISSPLMASKTIEKANSEMEAALQQEDEFSSMEEALTSNSDTYEYTYKTEESSEITTEKLPREPLFPEERGLGDPVTLAEKERDEAFQQLHYIRHISSGQMNRRRCKKGHFCYPAVFGIGLTALVIYLTSSQDYETTSDTTLGPSHIPVFEPCSDGKKVCDFLSAHNDTLPQGGYYTLHTNICNCTNAYYKRQPCYLPNDPDIAPLTLNDLMNLTDPEFTLSLRLHNNLTVCDPANSNITDFNITSTEYDDMPELVPAESTGD